MEALSAILLTCIRRALETEHAKLALVSTNSMRYPTSVAPFAVLKQNSSEAVEELLSLMEPGETVFLFQYELPTAHPRSSVQANVAQVLCLAFLSTTPIPFAREDVIPTLLRPDLDPQHALDMVDLIAIAFPGYYRPNTWQMGRYLGIRDSTNRLVAMGGERYCFELEGKHYREISALCTHPEHIGQGYASVLVRHLLTLHLEEGATSFLHTDQRNARALGLYEHLGFQRLHIQPIHFLTRQMD